MLYHYSAADKNGKIVQEEIEAENLNQVLNILSQKDLKPISVKPIKTGGLNFLNFFDGINLTDKLFLTKYLSLMLKVGTDLLSAVNILISDFDKPAMKNFLLEVRENLSRGRPFYQAFANHPKTFSLVFVNLVKASEVSGNLQQTFEDLSASIQKDAELKNKIRSALVYPIILSVMAILIIGFLVTFALPKIAIAFSQSGIKPPLFSRIVFGIGLFMGDHLGIISISLLIVVCLSIYFFWINLVGRRIANRMLERMPIIGKIYSDMAIKVFASTLSSLMKAGLPIVQSVNITAEVVGAERFKVSLKRIAEEGLTKGLTIGESFRRESVFPSVVTNLVAISEKAGHLDEVLKTLSEFYEANVEAEIKSLVSLLEPLLLLIMGLMVGLIAVAIIVPVYQLTSNF